MSNAAHPKDVHDKELGLLPAWDLTDLYRDPEAPELERDLQKADALASKFRQDYAGKLASLSGEDLKGTIAAYETLQDLTGKIMSYSYLVYAGNMSDARGGQFLQAVKERITSLSAKVLFFELELNKLEDERLAEMVAKTSLAHYEPWLRDLRARKKHQLGDEMERLLLEKRVSGRSAWVRLFDETIASLEFPFQGEKLGSAELLNKMTSRDGAERKEAAQSLGRVLGENIRLFAHITNTLTKDKETEDKWRHLDRPISSRNLDNAVEDEVVDALVSSVVGSYENLSHRYYALKAKWLGLEKLPYWDRNAPLPQDDDSLIAWDKAKSIVLSSYNSFSSELGALGQQFFDNPWIDAPLRQGKAPGAFAHPTVPSAHPYLLLNYQGRNRDVMTLAHELGHGVHQLLARKQGLLMADTPLTLAETASVFGEMLTFHALLDRESDPAKRKIMLASKVEDMLNTVVRQISMHCFESRVHEERRKGEILAERLDEIWMEEQKASLGPVFEFDESAAHFWAYIPHLVHTPFYVYAYAFGDCLVNSLYAVYQDTEEGFADRYLEMLSSGGSRHHRELLAPFGLDASDSAFWQKGLSVISSFIDELELMEQTGTQEE